jgi:hypothetical protein
MSASVMVCIATDPAANDSGVVPSWARSTFEHTPEPEERTPTLTISRLPDESIRLTLNQSLTAPQLTVLPTGKRSALDASMVKDVSPGAMLLWSSARPLSLNFCAMGQALLKLSRQAAHTLPN